MRYILALLIAALVFTAAYAYDKNPGGCRKLGLDIVSDTRAIFASPGSTQAGTDETAAAPEVSSVPAPQHFPMGYVAPSAAAAPAAPATTADSEPNLTSGQDLGDVVSVPGQFSFRAPKGWQISDSMFSKYKLVRDEPRNGFAANMNVVQGSYPGSLSDYIELNKSQLLGSPLLGYPKLLDEQPFTTSSGVQGIRLSISDTMLTNHMVQTYYFFAGSGDTKLLVTCSALAISHSQFAPIFEASMKTFTMP